MTQARTPADPSDPSLPSPPPVKNVEFKALLLLVFTALLVGASVLYLLYSRGAFETTQRLVLVADDSEGVVVGMNLTFSGFPIGRVRRIELAEDGNARILIDVPTRDAHWLRQSSVFTLVRGVVGNTNIRAYSGMLTDPPLPDGAVRQVLRGDASAEIPRVVSAAKELLDNLNALAAKEGPLGASLANLQAMTEKLNGPRGALGVLTGNDADAQKLILALDRTNTLLARLDGLVIKADGLTAKADAQVFGPQGVMPDVKAAIGQVNALLADTRESLKKMDAVLVEAKAVGANARVATEDLGTLRAEVESNLRKVEGLITEINRKWPFKRDTEIKLP
ncbi:MAG: MlaD family protein [Proteobacteria bacterium]|jgi:phospholipid/cholesterol/gamma-HCH transport system substrate-binding protein|nr:MlaD family protein [Pseudomonadota bacterium]